ncbi:Uncharacterised protein [Vibrio cholerae]|nr:Uncharacterised protein [Vibrio cholerae]CSH86984.1 Uncharacterised protein [Vibrio cholerae]
MFYLVVLFTNESKTNVSNQACKTITFRPQQFTEMLMV